MKNIKNDVVKNSENKRYLAYKKWIKLGKDTKPGYMTDTRIIEIIGETNKFWKIKILQKEIKVKKDEVRDKIFTSKEECFDFCKEQNKKWLDSEFVFDSEKPYCLINTKKLTPSFENTKKLFNYKKLINFDDENTYVDHLFKRKEPIILDGEKAYIDSPPLFDSCFLIGWTKNDLKKEETREMIWNIRKEETIQLLWDCWNDYKIEKNKIWERVKNCSYGGGQKGYKAKQSRILDADLIGYDMDKIKERIEFLEVLNFNQNQNVNLNDVSNLKISLRKIKRQDLKVQKQKLKRKKTKEKSR